MDAKLEEQTILHALQDVVRLTLEQLGGHGDEFAVKAFSSNDPVWIVADGDNHPLLQQMDGNEPALFVTEREYQARRMAEFHEGRAIQMPMYMAIANAQFCGVSCYVYFADGSQGEMLGMFPTVAERSDEGPLDDLPF